MEATCKCLRDFQAILRQFDTCIVGYYPFYKNICSVCGSAMYYFGVILTLHF